MRPQILPLEMDCFLRVEETTTPDKLMLYKTSKFLIANAIGYAKFAQTIFCSAAVEAANKYRNARPEIQKDEIVQHEMD